MGGLLSHGCGIFERNRFGTQCAQRSGPDSEFIELSSLSATKRAPDRDPTVGLKSRRLNERRQSPRPTSDSGNPGTYLYMCLKDGKKKNGLRRMSKAVLSSLNIGRSQRQDGVDVRRFNRRD